MSTTNSTTKRTYHHLRATERGQIEAYLKEGKSKAEIARLLGYHRSTISREIKRAQVPQKRWKNGKLEDYMAYFADTAQKLAIENKQKSYYLKLKSCNQNFLKELTEAVTAKPRIHSIDSFVVTYSRQHPNALILSTKTVYNYIHQGLLAIKPIDLPKMTRLKPKPKVKTATKKHLGTSIDERPEEINRRESFGNWEIDLVLGGKKRQEAVVLTLVERLTRYAVVRKLPDKRAETINQAVKELHEIYHFLSITADNGSEFASLSDLEDIAIYYAHPYSSHERGSNENFNGLLREFLPKGQSFNHVSETEIESCVSAINQRPRRLFDYQTAQNRFGLAQSTSTALLV